ncbi:MAG: tetratricopeptide repeat protein [Saprospiraceae bacterium]|nr:tetratricopeptide repeat protein [Pyrinomonadaceae bacterium]
MGNKSVWISIIAAAFCFVGGFLLANALNRSEMDGIKAENDGLRTVQANNARETANVTLTSEEIQKKISEADQNPKNFHFQKGLGMGLYRYASMKQDAAILAEALRLLARANDIDPEDREVQVGLGNAYFDTGYFNKDNKSFVSAREFYRKALSKRPSDAEVRTDLGLTYFLQEPPDLSAAIEEFEASLKIDPAHEKTLQFLVQSQVKKNDGEKARQFLDQLKKANPENQSIPELTSLVDQIVAAK